MDQRDDGESVNAFESAEAAAADELHGMVGRTPVMRELFRQIALVAPLEATVLIEGESGAGKEMVARALHRLSPRAAAPFLTLNAAEISPALFESELFGHVEGAFAGALEPREGLAVAAAGGTLLVKEVQELTLAHQQALQRFIETGEVCPVGGGKPRPVDVRILCSASANLRQEPPAQGLDEALYLHLRAFTLWVPPIKERREDLPLLIEHFLQRYMILYAKEINGISPSAEDLLCAQAWPGNVRQLAEEMERAVVLTPAGGRVEPEVFSERIVAP